MYSKRLLNKVSRSGSVGSGRREREGGWMEERKKWRGGKEKRKKNGVGGVGGRSEGIAGQREETGNGRILLFPL